MILGHGVAFISQIFHLSQISDQDCEGLKCFMLQIHEVRSKADSNIFRVKWIAQASGTAGYYGNVPKQTSTLGWFLQGGKGMTLKGSNWEIGADCFFLLGVDVVDIRC